MSGPPAKACAVVLAGGAGTRIRHLHPDVPKPLIPVGGRPWLEWICRYWIRQGIRRVAISLGHMADVAERQIAWSWPGVEIRTVREETPLGTGGALRFAADAMPEGDPVLALNGDSLLVADLTGAWKLLEDDAGAAGVVVGVEMEDASRFGTLRVDAGGVLRGFDEKRPGRGWINAGIYLFRRQTLRQFPAAEPLSMEHDVFPSLLESGARLRVFCAAGDFIDIGSPDSLAVAAAFVERHAKELAG